ncbi:MAG: VWA domain-containing protein [Planctomycetota bacterium]
MSFAWPDGLPLLLIAPLIAVLLFVVAIARRRRLQSVIGPRMRALAGQGSMARRALFPVAVLFALLALVQPLWGESSFPGEPVAMDTVLCLDVSRSMLAQDVEPSRLERAQAEIRELAARAAGDRLGLVVFAGEARLVVPLTRDLGSLAEIAAMQDPLSVARGGSDLGAAIDAARATRPDAIVLLTDGEDLEETGLRAARRTEGIEIHCIGYGTTLGAKIPDRDGFVRDAGGREVISRLNPGRLGRIGESHTGSLPEVYENRIRKSFRAKDISGLANRYQWPLLAACLFWILDLCVSDKRR